MTLVETPAPPDGGDPAAWILQRAVSPRRRFFNACASAWMIGSLLVALVPVSLIAVYVASKGAGQINFGFLTKNLPVVTEFPGGGIAPAIVGTLVITGVAALMAIPLGVLAAVYLNEYGRRQRIAKVIRFMADVMTGVPSIVMGLFVATIWVSAGLHFGYSGFAGSLALAALMLPIVIRSCEEMLKLVPADLRQASDALGARRWRTVASVVIPTALPGIVSGAMLAVAARCGRDRTAAVHDRRHEQDPTERLPRHQHDVVAGDLVQRPDALRSRPGPGLGRGADPHRHRVRADGDRATRVVAVRDGQALAAPGRVTRARRPGPTRG